MTRLARHIKLVKLAQGNDSTAFLFRWLVISIFFVGMQLTTWLPLRFWKIWGGGGFIDTAQVLRYADCFQKAGLKIYDSGNGLCNNYIYGRSLIYFLKFLHAGESNSFFIGFVFLILASGVLAWTLPWRSTILSCLIVLSPPVLLLVERGNFDLLILGGILLSSYLWAKEHRFSALLLIFILSLFKFYTLPILLIPIVISKNLRDRIFGIILFLTAIPFILQDILISKSGYPEAPYSQFGAKVWLKIFQEYIEFPDSISLVTILTILIFVFFLLLAFYFIKYKGRWSLHTSPVINSTDPINIFGLFTLVVFLTCFILGMNFDYRLIFLVVSFGVLKSYFEVTFHIRFQILFLSALWLSFPSGGLQPIGDVLLEFFVAISILQLLSSYVRRFNFFSRL